MARIVVIGAIFFLLGFAVGKWWFAAVVAVAVAVVVAITSNVEVSSTFLGVFFGSAVFFVMFLGTVLRWLINSVLSERRAQRAEKGLD